MRIYVPPGRGKAWWSRLAPRQKTAIVRPLLIAGASNKSIAESLGPGITPNSVASKRDIWNKRGKPDEFIIVSSPKDADKDWGTALPPVVSKKTKSRKKSAKKGSTMRKKSPPIRKEQSEEKIESDEPAQDPRVPLAAIPSRRENKIASTLPSDLESPQPTDAEVRATSAREIIEAARAMDRKQPKVDVSRSRVVVKRTAPITDDSACQWPRASGGSLKKLLICGDPAQGGLCEHHRALIKRYRR